MKPCLYFARGTCRYGDSCRSHHETRAGLNPLSEPFTTTSPNASIPGPNGSIDTLSLEDNVLSQVCTYHLRGTCRRGLYCWYAHPATTVPTEENTPSADQFGGPETEIPNISHQSLDSPGTTPCKYSFQPGGCRRALCPYLHPISSQNGNDINGREVDGIEDEVDIALPKTFGLKD